jgi:hypothetical protein
MRNVEPRFFNVDGECGSGGEVKSLGKLAQTKKGLVWIGLLSLVLGAAFLFLSGSLWNWIGFAATLLIGVFFLARALKRDAWELAARRCEAEGPLWKAAGEAIHDVGTPLHVVRFCVQQLVENPSLATTPRFIEQITRGSDRTLQAFERLRVFTRAIRDEEGPTSFRLGYAQALRVVQARFPDHPALKSLQSAEPPDEIVHIGSGSLIRALSVLIGRCLSAPGTISVSVEPSSEQLRIAIAGEAGGDSQLDFETQSVRHLVEEWGGELKRLFIPERGAFGYTLHLAREVRG